jgi:hypothetical protein
MKSPHKTSPLDTTLDSQKKETAVSTAQSNLAYTAFEHERRYTPKSVEEGGKWPLSMGL